MMKIHFLDKNVKLQYLNLLLIIQDGNNLQSLINLNSRNMFIVGDIFMSEFYTVFNRENNTVGLAKAYH